MLDVVVVGAGAAGIAAARRAVQLGLTVMVVEAKPTVGGRASTDNVTFGVPFDRGCYWLHSPEHNPLKARADELGIRYLNGAQEVRYSREGRWLNGAETGACKAYIEASFERVEAAGRAGQDCAASELFAEPHPWHAAFEAEFIAKQGVPLNEASTLDFARYVWTGEDLPVIGGLGNLIHRLARGLSLSVDTPVSRMELSTAGSVRLDTPRGTLEARAAILTISTGVLQSGAIRFSPELPGWKRDAIGALPMGSCNKIALSFVRPVLDVCDDCMVLPLRGPIEAVELVLRPGGYEMAIGLLNGPFGKEIAEAGASAMAEYVLERLVEVFGSDLRKALYPVQVMADWDRDPFVRGYVSAALPGLADARLNLLRPIDDRLFFAGEATSLNFMGDVHGAWLSGIEAAEAVARALYSPS
ncbi:MAG TPA: NAD(P)/FAD-dependent oxidoreductase [Alphaproteobacteria bacterium]|nr:NAD(P)/FAD-dependent oxidoreductase [Alphaproteobacteria bacterium]